MPETGESPKLMDKNNHAELDTLMQCNMLTPTTTMSKPWRIFPLFLVAASAFASSQSFGNTAIVRTIELGGSVAHITTTYAIKSQEDGLTTYRVALGRDDKEKTSWLEAKVKGQKTALVVKEHAFDVDGYVDFYNSSQSPVSIVHLQGNIIPSILFCQKRCPSMIH